MKLKHGLPLKEWHDIALKIKNKAQWTCQICHRPENKQLGIRMGVHCRSYDKRYRTDADLICLCGRCHLMEERKISGKVQEQKKETQGQGNLLHGKLFASIPIKS